MVQIWSCSLMSWNFELVFIMGSFGSSKKWSLALLLRPRMFHSMVSMRVESCSPWHSAMILKLLPPKKSSMMLIRSMGLLQCLQMKRERSILGGVGSRAGIFLLDAEAADAGDVVPIFKERLFVRWPDFPFWTGVIGIRVPCCLIKVDVQELVANAAELVGHY